MPNWNCTFQNAGKQMASLKSTSELKGDVHKCSDFCFLNVLSSSTLSFFSIRK